MYKPGRMISGFTAFIDRILILLLSAGLLVLAVDPDLAGTAGSDRGPLLSAERVEQFRVLAIFVGVALVCLNLNVIQFILYNIWNNETRRYIQSKTASGTARVSLDAIQRSLMATAKAMPEVARCRLNVFRVGHTRYKVGVLFWMREGSSVVNISERLRLVLKKRFSDLVTISPQDRVDFDITLAGIEKQKRSPGQQQGAPGAPAPFKGPVYPVEGET